MNNTGTEVERIYRERNQGQSAYWFDRDTLRFFKSRIGQEYWRDYGTPHAECFFVTSERGPSGVRRHTVRQLTVAGEIETIGEFNSLNRAQANRIAAKLAAERQQVAA